MGHPFWSKISYNAAVSYALPSGWWDCSFMDDCNSVGAIDNAWLALRKSSEFLSICMFPGVPVFGV